MSDTTIISVRGTARLDVEPDAAHVSTTIISMGQSARESSAAAAIRTDNVCASIGKLGGQAAHAEDVRLPLSYSRISISTREERVWDEKQRANVSTGKFITSVGLQLTVRTFDTLEKVTAALVSSGAQVNGVGWRADHDNPGWREVRRAAVQVAIAQARDYAEALGGRLDTLEHLADAGLLGSDHGRDHDMQASFGAAPLAMGRRGASDSETEVPNLTPVPQRLTATVEARFRVSGITL